MRLFVAISIFATACIAAPAADNYIPGHYRPTHTTDEKISPSVIHSVIPSTTPGPAPKPAQVSNIPKPATVSNIPAAPQVSNIPTQGTAKANTKVEGKQQNGKKQEAEIKLEEWWEQHEWS